MMLSCRATAKDTGKRAVDVLVRHTGMSHYLGKKIRLYGRLEVNGQFQRMIDPVQAGDFLVATYTAPGELPEGVRLVDTAGIHILWQDDWALVVDKPTPLLTHPAYDGQKDSLITLLTDGNLHPVSRLDRNTSGLVLLARNGHAHHVLSQQEITKDYLGLVHGSLTPAEGTIDLPIARRADSIIEREVSSGGKASLTHYQTEAYYSITEKNSAVDCSLVRFRLETGRTHQIRVHTAAIGHPLLGDSLYGQSSPTRAPLASTEQRDYLETKINRQALHACRLVFAHPISGELIEAEADLPADMKAVIASLNLLSPDSIN